MANTGFCWQFLPPVAAKQLKMGSLTEIMSEHFQSGTKIVDNLWKKKFASPSRPSRKQVSVNAVLRNVKTKEHKI